MIIKFKIFENEKSKKYFIDLDDLTGLLSQQFIENYYEENYEIDIEDAVNSVNLWSYVDKNSVASVFIQDLIDDTKIDDKEFYNTDYMQYIYNTEYNEIAMEKLQKMSRKKLIEIIENEGEEREFMTNYFEDKYKDTHPEDILIDVYGKHSTDDNRNIYSYIKDFIDDNEIIEIYKNNIQFECKLGYIEDFICIDKNLQKILLDMNPNTAEALYNEMEKDKSIGDEYKFQKIYIDIMFKQEEGIESEEIYPKLLKKLNDKFGLNFKIKKEYQDYLYLIDAEKYNI